jgi:hypothetical protein
MADSVIERIKALIQQRTREDRMKSEAKKRKGLVKKIGDPNYQMSSKEKLMLKSMLTAGKIEGRTDEGALMGLRHKYPQF